MAEITYSKPTWADGTTPALSAANLQALVDAVDKLCHYSNRGGAIVRADTLNENTDSNGGQPPAPKPSVSASGQGRQLIGQTSNASIYYAGSTIGDAGHTWRLDVTTITTATGAVVLAKTGYGLVGPGNGSVVAPTSLETATWSAWRLS